MRTFFLVIYFMLYQIWYLLRRVKYEWLKKHSTKERHEQYLYGCSTTWAKDMLKAAGVKVEVSGSENIPKEACLFVSNHQSYFDVPILMAVIDRSIGFIAKKEIEKVPFMNYWMKELHSVFMDRDNIREAVKSINEGIENLQNGYSMVIFPEGTRSKCDTVGEFKKGSMKLGIKAGAPIIPVTINGAYKAFEGNNNRVKSADVKIVFGEPIYPKNLSKEEQNNLAEVFKGIICKNI